MPFSQTHTSLAAVERRVERWLRISLLKENDLYSYYTSFNLRGIITKCFIYGDARVKRYSLISGSMNVRFSCKWRILGWPHCKQSPCCWNVGHLESFYFPGRLRSFEAIPNPQNYCVEGSVLKLLFFISAVVLFSVLPWRWRRRGGKGGWRWFPSLSLSLSLFLFHSCSEFEETEILLIHSSLDEPDSIP